MTKNLFLIWSSMLNTSCFLACIFSILLMLPGGHALKLEERKAMQKVAENIRYMRLVIVLYHVAKKLDLFIICINIIT